MAVYFVRLQTLDPILFPILRKRHFQDSLFDSLWSAHKEKNLLKN